MNDASVTPQHEFDSAPGDERFGNDEFAKGLIGYVVGLSLAVLLTAIAFYLAGHSAFWQPSIPVALSVLAIAQMGVHLVFFLHMTTSPDSINNILALAFGLLIVFLVMTGSLWIMSHLNQNMLPMDRIMSMQR